jgi:hypothetical protein
MDLRLDGFADFDVVRGNTGGKHGRCAWVALGINTSTAVAMARRTP